MHGHSMRENREIHWLPAAMVLQDAKGRLRP
jgi:hypothetical protein